MKKIKMLAGVMAFLVVLSGCGSNLETAPSENDATSLSSNEQTVSIKTHNSTREELTETFDKAPEVVTTAWLNSLENMLALGLGDRISVAMGVSEDEILPEYREEFSKVGRIQNEVISKEEMISINPDLILGWRSTFGDKDYGDVNFWHERGNHTYIAYNTVKEIQNLENEYEDILNLGRIFQKEDKAEALVDEMKAKVEQGKEIAKGKEPVRIAILEDEGGVFRVYGEDTVGGDIAKQVGADLVAKTKNEKKSAEEIIELNPDVIFSVHFGDHGEHSDALNPKTSVEVFQNNPVYQNIDAVKNNRVYPIDLSYIHAPGVRVGHSIDYFIEHLYE